MNRPGTDWDAWVAMWDLTTGRRTVLRNACAPIALSPDGVWLAARRYERTRNPGFGADPSGELALWQFGTEKPTKVLRLPDAAATAPASEPLQPAEPADPVHAVVFTADSRRALGLVGNVRIAAWSVEGEEPGAELGQFVVRDRVLTPGPGRYAGAAVLERLPGGLLAVVPVSARSVYGEPHPYALGIEWRWSAWNADRLEQTRVYTFASGPSRAYAQSVAGILSNAQEPWALSLPLQLFEGFTRPRSGIEPAPWVAVAPKVRRIALVDKGLIVVHKIGGPELARFPGLGPMQFTPDGDQVIAWDRRGVLRFWDIASETIARSLRLDDQPPETFRVAAVQCASEFGDPAKNRKELAWWVSHAVSAGAEVVVLPETAVTGYMSPDLKRTWQVGDRPITPGLIGVDPKDAAETVPGPSTRFFANLTRQYGVYLTVPLLEVDRKTGRYYNTVVLLGPDGSQLTHYRKLNPWPWAERSWAGAGDLGRPVADTPFGRLATLICFDIHEQAAPMAELGIDTLLYSIAWVDNRGSDWFPRKLPQIAAKNGFHIVGANWTVPPPRQGDAPPDWHGYGQSCVITAAGQMLATARGDRWGEMVLADLPLPARPKEPD